jgi:hypothetical protein
LLTQHQRRVTGTGREREREILQAHLMPAQINPTESVPAVQDGVGCALCVHQTSLSPSLPASAALLSALTTATPSCRPPAARLAGWLAGWRPHTRLLPALPQQQLVTMRCVLSGMPQDTRGRCWVQHLRHSRLCLPVCLPDCSSAYVPASQPASQPVCLPPQLLSSALSFSTAFLTQCQQKPLFGCVQWPDGGVLPAWSECALHGSYQTGLGSVSLHSRERNHTSSRWCAALREVLSVSQSVACSSKLPIHTMVQHSTGKCPSMNAKTRMLLPSACLSYI